MKRSVWIVLGVLLLFFIFINIFIKNPSYTEPEAKIAFAISTKQYSLAEESYLELIKLYPDSMDFYYGHIICHFQIPKKQKTDVSEDAEIRDDSEIYQFYDSLASSPDINKRNIGYYATGLCYSVQDQYDSALFYFGKVENRNLKYLNNSLGFVYINQLKYEVAEKFLLKEIANNGFLNGAYSNLISLYLQTNQPDKLEVFINNGLTGYFSQQDLREFYLKTGNFAGYFLQIVAIGYQNIDFKSFIAALFIMLIWLFFLRRIDLFEPEKWQYIILTFFLGVLFSYSAFILYDFVEYKIGFTINGNVVNDFFYCFIVIGIIEETVKLIPFLIILKFSHQVNEPVDYIIYPSISALGFAFAENIQYFHGLGLDIIHGRALVSVVIHMICSSIIGYGLYFGLGKTELSKAKRIILFLFIAALVHGFFDFWLINEKVSDLSFISIFFVLFCISAWNSFINHALNFSVPDDVTIHNLNHKKLQDYLIYGLSGVLIFEYLMVSINFGPKVGNSSLMSAAYSGTYLIAFISSSLGVFLIDKNKKGIRLYRKKSDSDAVVGKDIEISGSETDDYKLFPQNGRVISRESIQEEDNWYLVKIENPFQNSKICRDYIMIKPEGKGEGIENGTRIGLYLVLNDRVLVKNDKTKNDFLFAGWGICKILHDEKRISF